MARLQTPAGRPVATPIVLVAGGSLPLKLIPATGERLPFTVTTSGIATADVAMLNNRLSANFATFQLRGRAAGEVALTIVSANDVRMLPITVRVVARLELPAAGTDAGLLARLFLAEAPPPRTDEDLPRVAQAITLMRVVLENRRDTPSARWGSAGARSLGDVVRARGQFEGFGGYPTLNDRITAQIADILKIANDPADSRQTRMRAHVDQVVAIASGPSPRDPTRTGLYWWRTEGSGPPGTGVTLHTSVLGNSFYREAD